MRWYENFQKSPKHQHIHELADVLITQHDAGEKKHARSGLAELNSAGEELVAMQDKLAES